MHFQFFGLILLCLSLSSRATPLSSHPPSSDPSSSSSKPPASLNLLDIISQSPDHTILVRLFQRTRLIPTLNKLQFKALEDGHGITILAPTDKAIKERAELDQNMRLQRETVMGIYDESRTKILSQGQSFTAEYFEQDSQLQSSTSNDHVNVFTQPKLSLWEWAMRVAEEAEEQEHDSTKLVWRPTDPAPRSPGPSPPSPQEHENIHALLRQELLYHILNFTLPFNTTSTSALDPDSTLIRAQPQMISTLHLPSRKLLTDPTRPGDDPHPYPPGSPEIPHPGDEDKGGLLGGEGQKLRYHWKSYEKEEDSSVQASDLAGNGKEAVRSLYFGVDSKGKGGVKASEKGIITSELYGKIVSLDGCLDLPPPLETVIKTHSSLSQLSTLLSHLPDLLSTFSTSAHLTLFLPASESFETDLSRLEFDYLNGDWTVSNQDKMKFLAWHASSRGLGDGKIGYIERIRKELDHGGLEITKILGGEVRLEDDEGQIKIFNIDLDDDPSLKSTPRSSSSSVEDSRTSHLIDEDLLVENGVIHIISNQLLPEHGLELNIEKTLLALNATHFVDLIHQAGLETYVNRNVYPPKDGDGDEEPPSFTFFVPKDDAIEDWLRSKEVELGLNTLDSTNPESDSSNFIPRFNSVLKTHPGLTSETQFQFGTVPKKGSRELEELMRYHIAPSQLKKENLTDSMLIGTELRNWKLKQGRQRIRVEVDDKGVDYDYHGARKGRKDGEVEIGFGDANVLAEPIIVGNSIIYIISQLLTPPADPIQVAVSTLSLSTFVAACSVSDLSSTLKRAPGVTLLIPHNEAFNSLGLVMPYLLLDETESRKELRSLVEYHAIDRIVYRQDFHLINQDNNTGGQIYPTLEGSEIWAGRLKNGSIEIRKGGSGTTGRNAAKVLKTDKLTSTGVIQEIDSVELPPTLDLTIGKLMKGASASTMASLIRKAGYEYILNGTLPEDEETQALDDELHISKGGGMGRHKKRRRNPKKEHRKRHKMFRDLSQAYVVLTPTDQAFTRINLSYYLEDKEALKQLVQLHIIPSPADEILPGSNGGNENLLPISIKDEKILTSLLDSKLGGSSNYGKLAFREDFDRKGLKKNDRGDEDEVERLGWIVGIANSRGSSTRNHAANILTFGRESPATLTDGDDLGIPMPSSDGLHSLGKKGRRGKVPLPGENWNSKNVGGILTIDSVLEPYEPNWFFKWGYVMLYVILAMLVLGGLGFWLWNWRNRSGNIRLPDAMEGEEE